MFRIAYLKTFWALVYRDLRFIVRQLPGRLIDGAIIVFMQTLAIGQFLPLLGMPAQMIAPLYIGTITQIVFSAAYGICFKYVTDLHKDRFINYQLALPLPKTLLFAQIIFAFMIEVAFVSLPLIFLGSIFLGPAFSLHNAHWISTIAMFLLNILLKDVYGKIKSIDPVTGSRLWSMRRLLEVMQRPSYVIVVGQRSQNKSLGG